MDTSRSRCTAHEHAFDKKCTGCFDTSNRCPYYGHVSSTCPQGMDRIGKACRWAIDRVYAGYCRRIHFQSTKGICFHEHVYTQWKGCRSSVLWHVQQRLPKQKERKKHVDSMPRATKRIFPLFFGDLKPWQQNPNDCNTKNSIKTVDSKTGNAL